MNENYKKTPAEQRAERRRKQVLDAAEACFLKSGFHVTSMAEISKAASMSVGHIYNYFEGKEMIICALVERQVNEFLALLAQASESEQNFVEALKASLESDYKKGLTIAQVSLIHDVLAEIGRNDKITQAILAYDANVRRFLVEKCTAYKPEWTPLEVTLRMELVLSLLNSCTFRYAVNPDLDISAYKAEIGRTLDLLFER